MDPIPKLDTISVADLAKLYETKGSGLTTPQLKQTRVPLGALRTAPRVFQPRDMADRKWVKDRHIDVLVKALKESGKLDHIDVFPVDGFRIVVDGHCRLDAYRRAGVKTTQRVPVRHLSGTFADALKASVSTNSKDKLALTIDEKSEAAWRMVLHDEHQKCYSLRTIAEATGIGKSTVGNMRRTLTEILDCDRRSCSWRDIKRKQRTQESYDDDWQEKLRLVFARRLRKAFGEKPNQQPEVFLDAIEHAYPLAYHEMLCSVARERRDELLEIAEVEAEASDF